MINTKRIIKKELVFTSKLDLARFKALQCKESNAWLHAIPSSNIGTFMDSNSIRICIGLRLGCDICLVHTCLCGSVVSARGLHGLSCLKSAGRYLRHIELNEIISRALMSLHIPNHLEPKGLSRNDGKKPDGVTLTPWSKGKPLVWDATCVDTFADSYLSKTSKKAAFAVETMGPWSTESKNFINTIGSKLQELTGDKKSKFYLTQRISLAIQRFNASCVMGTIPAAKPLEEIFYL
ncbi:uncharacterized protein LOC119069645 [Bradysia coprophila]|uniref:uncharacterized protein LOC119069645 n=1 Tax=Bradysia coprophila TaxID=38358 RepID=UPI00187D9F10|nr:uncharacterized protein LOC119069645 [Bradysia coprophila]